ncbi:MAG: D-alanyl-D-alanine carboxypeptidase family protein [Oscillospiraceae bacterium]|nr:D-alanyl-D-alanine carboxypeptidase family protein [Oscillospiraceae bacterium]
MWTTSNETVATVDSLGNITAKSEGKCVITVASAQNPDVYANVAITVSPETQITYIDGILIANKTYALPSDYAPGVDPEAEAAFHEMQTAAAELGLNLYISSGYRSYDYQAGLYQRYVDRSGQAEADRYSARPGHSEHQTGLAFDLNTISDEFKDTDEGKWVAENCHKYGFIVRYPEDKEAITGYMYEPWHIRYLGTDIATNVFESGLCLEEYLGITSEYNE